MALNLKRIIKAIERQGETIASLLFNNFFMYFLNFNNSLYNNTLQKFNFVNSSKTTRKTICTSFGNGKKHDFKVYKESKIHIQKDIKILADTGFTGIHKIHAFSDIPKKRYKKKPLNKDDKEFNHFVSSQRMSNEHAIGFIKRFKILSEKYRNRRKRFSLRFNLIAGICNFDRSI